jgi:hypothetical protein
VRFSCSSVRKASGVARPFRFPPVRLRSRPQELRRAVAGLSSAAVDSVPSPSRLAEFRQQLLQKSAKAFAVSMSARQTRWLAHVAAEGSPVVNARVAAVAIELIALQRVGGLLYLVPWLHAHSGLMGLLAAVAEAEWGSSRIPDWLARLDGGASGLADSQLGVRFVEGTRKQRIPWSRVVEETRLPGDSPLAMTAVRMAVATPDRDWLRSQDDSDVAAWAGKQALPREIAVHALVRLLGSRASSIPSSRLMREIQSGGISALLDSLARRLGGPLWQRARLWAEVPEDVKRLARLARSIEVVLQNFEDRRQRFWLKWLGKADSVEPIRTGVPFGQQLASGAADAVLIKLRGRCFLEFSTTGNACYAYSESDWSSIRRRARIPTVQSLKLKSYVKGPNWLRHHHGDWEQDFATYIKRLKRGV